MGGFQAGGSAGQENSQVFKMPVEEEEEEEDEEEDMKNGPNVYKNIEELEKAKWGVGLSLKRIRNKRQKKKDKHRGCKTSQTALR